MALLASSSCELELINHHHKKRFVSGELISPSLDYHDLTRPVE